MSVSSSLNDVDELERIESIPVVQALNFSKGSDTSNALVSSFQPNSILISSNSASALSLESETKSTLGIGSDLFIGRPRVKMANSTAAAARLQLSPMSTIVVVISSM